jgi:hypothetical protein
MVRRVVALAIGLMLFAATAACSDDSSGDSSRPKSDARIQIVEPTPSATTSPDITVKFNVIGGTVLPPEQVTGALRGDQGHIHVRIDGKTVEMSYGSELPLTKLAPGPHTVQAEFVAVDHQPFSNRPVAAVVFEVKA